jgi:hypothetical protein
MGEIENVHVLRGVDRLENETLRQFNSTSRSNISPIAPLSESVPWTYLVRKCQGELYFI